DVRLGAQLVQLGRDLGDARLGRRPRCPGRDDQPGGSERRGSNDHAAADTGRPDEWTRTHVATRSFVPLPPNRLSYPGRAAESAPGGVTGKATADLPVE